MTDAAPEPEGSEEEIKRKFREALECKRAKHADANAARGGKDAGKVHGARGLARGFMFARDGELVVSMCQEGLMRLAERQPKPAG